MDKNKCPQCGLINLGTDSSCRRCGSSFVEEPHQDDRDESSPRKRGVVRRLIWIVGVTLLLLFGFYFSLLLTSNDLGFQQREVVGRAVTILEQRGFSKEAFIVGHLATYRSSDNWWNTYVGHGDAYAATNFPFEVLTLYPEFFQVSVDDNERAAMLLHEAYHLLGSGEDAALEGVWRNKNALGWTRATYAQSKVWNNTRELTMNRLPGLFQCGNDGKSDCFE
ncbi:MAG TPA: hypothetical protein VE135_25315 [Pyrinomonadaceae bacterium]|nr:hypothetical protein [Pyrinomonadaceae bacterium]